VAPHARIANTLLAFRLAQDRVQVRDLGPIARGASHALLGLGVADRRSGYPLETVLAAARAGWQITDGRRLRARARQVQGHRHPTGTLQAVRT